MIRFLTAFCAGLLLCVGPAFGATVTVSTSDALWAAVRAGVAGDVVLLTDSATPYPAISFYSNDQYPLFVKAGAGVTIMPAPGAHPVLAGLKIDGAAGLTFRGLEIQMAPADQYGVYVGNSARVTLDGLTVHQADGSLQGVGVFARDSSDVTVSNSEFHHLGVGVSAMDTVRASITTSRFHDLETDGVDFAGAPGARLTFNVFSDFRPATGDHPDVAQSWGTAANPTPDGLWIEGNVFRRGLGDPTLPPQGIFIAYAKNVTIRNNAFSCTLYNGISLSGVQTGLIEGNFDQGCSDFGSRIIVRGGSDSVTVRGNWVSQAIVNLVQAGEPANTNVLDGGQTTIPGIVTPPAGTAPDTTLMDQWVATHIATAPPPAPIPAPTPDPAPVPAVDPRDAQIADLTAQVATLTQAAADDAVKMAAASASSAASAAQAAKYATGLKTVISLGTTANAKRQGPTKADMNGVISAAKSALQ